MKQFTITLLVVSLCFSLSLSCGGNASADVKSGLDKVNKAVEKPSKNDNIKKVEESNKPLQRNPTRKVIGADLKNKSASDEMASSSKMRKRYEENMSTPITEEQIKVADKICACLNEQKLFSKLKKAKTKQHVFTIAGYDNDEEVKPMQDCYNKNMIPAVKKLGKGRNIFSMKSRNYLNKKCLDGTNNFWISIGGYIGRNEDKEAVRIDNLN